MFMLLVGIARFEFDVVRGLRKNRRLEFAGVLDAPRAWSDVDVNFATAAEQAEPTAARVRSTGFNRLNFVAIQGDAGPLVSSFRGAQFR